MPSGKFSLKNADLRLLKTSILAFAIAFFPPVFFEALFGSHSLPITAWLMVPVAFHEIGHLVFSVFGMSTPLHYLGGFLFNGIAGLVLLCLSLAALSRIYSGRLPKRFKPVAFSFLFIACLNLFMLPYTLTHLVHVVGPGLDFTMAPAMLGISLQQLLAWLWAFSIIALASAFLLNLLFVCKKK